MPKRHDMRDARGEPGRTASRDPAQGAGRTASRDHDRKVRGDPAQGAGPVATNRRAGHDYFVHETYEAGLELKGSEVKSVRNHKVSLEQSFGRLSRGELYLVGMNIAPYEQAGPFGHEPLRPRKLLLRRRQIREISAQLVQRGFTLVPLRVYFRHGFAKVAIGLASGKRQYDKREAIKKREAERHIRGELGRARKMGGP